MIETPCKKNPTATAVEPQIASVERPAVIPYQAARFVAIPRGTVRRLSDLGLIMWCTLAEYRVSIDSATMQALARGEATNDHFRELAIGIDMTDRTLLRTVAVNTGDEKYRELARALREELASLAAMKGDAWALVKKSGLVWMHAPVPLLDVEPKHFRTWLEVRQFLVVKRDRRTCKMEAEVAQNVGVTLRQVRKRITALRDRGWLQQRDENWRLYVPGPVLDGQEW